MRVLPVLRGGLEDLLNVMRMGRIAYIFTEQSYSTNWAVEAEYALVNSTRVIQFMNFCIIPLQQIFVQRISAWNNIHNVSEGRSTRGQGTPLGADGRGHTRNSIGMGWVPCGARKFGICNIIKNLWPSELPKPIYFTKHLHTFVLLELLSHALLGST